MKVWLMGYYNRRMSHFIENTYDLQSQPVLKTISKEIVIPPLSSFKHRLAEGCDGQGEKKMLKMMFFQLQNSELGRVHRENSLQMRKQFQRLRTKLARRAQLQTVQKAMERKERLPKLQLSQILKMNPQKIDLLKKHRSKIYGRLAVFHEAESISKEKEQYNSWYNTTKNSPLKSPIYTKMNYLLEKIYNKQNREVCSLNKWIDHGKKVANPVIAQKTSDSTF